MMKNNSGFSLVELSIVLVILGLLVGGILGGQSLIQAAELRKIATSRDAINVAANTFYSKYGKLPGDFNLATRFWDEAADCSTRSTHVAAGTLDGVCNGDGNGALIGYPSLNFDEGGLLWQHLSLAGLIPDHIDGNGSVALGYDMMLPESGYQGKYFSLSLLTTYSPSTTVITPVTAIMLLDSAGSSLNLLTPTDLWSLDTKMDDGDPYRGTIWASGGACLTTDADGNYIYNVSNASAACNSLLIFPVQAKDRVALTS